MAFLYDSTEDVMEEILSWLSPKSLIECKCINKSWNSFISSKIKNPSFVNKHIRKSLASSTSIVFRRSRLHPEYRRFDHDKPLSLLTLFHDGDGKDRINFTNEILEIPPLSGVMETGSVWVYHHCNGIFCTVNKDNTMLLCNPELREFRAVPKSNYDLKPLDIIQPYYGDLRGMGFGYDSRADDYKIIFLFHGIEYTIGAEVYNMSTNSWREIRFMEGKIFDNYGWKAEKGVYCKGYYYWLVVIPFGERSILSFDMCNEVFRILPSSPDVVSKKDIAVWNDFVVLFSLSFDARLRSLIDIWVMDDHDKWRKHLSIGPFEDIMEPLTFWKRDELLMFYSDGEIASYNTRSKKLRKLAIHKDDRMIYWGFHVKSLVSINYRRGSVVNREIYPNGNIIMSLKG